MRDVSGGVAVGVAIGVAVAVGPAIADVVANTSPTIAAKAVPKKRKPRFIQPADLAENNWSRSKVLKSNLSELLSLTPRLVQSYVGWIQLRPVPTRSHADGLHSEVRNAPDALRKREV
jgi:hypothetical protein